MDIALSSICYKKMSNDVDKKLDDTHIVLKYLKKKHVQYKYKKDNTHMQKWTIDIGMVPIDIGISSSKSCHKPFKNYKSW